LTPLLFGHGATSPILASVVVLSRVVSIPRFCGSPFCVRPLLARSVPRVASGVVRAVLFAVGVFFHPAVPPTSCGRFRVEVVLLLESFTFVGSMDFFFFPTLPTSPMGKVTSALTPKSLELSRLTEVLIPSVGSPPALIRAALVTECLGVPVS